MNQHEAIREQICTTLESLLVTARQNIEHEKAILELEEVVDMLYKKLPPEFSDKRLLGLLEERQSVMRQARALWLRAILADYEF